MKLVAVVDLTMTVPVSGVQVRLPFRLLQGWFLREDSVDGSGVGVVAGIYICLRDVMGCRVDPSFTRIEPVVAVGIA